MEKSVLIFGVNGFVGSYLTREFLEHGYEAYGSDRAAECDVEGLSAFRCADITDHEAVESIIRDLKPGIIINLAAISSVGLSWKLPQATMEVNVIGTINILQGASMLRDAPKVLLIGSSEEYAPSEHPLAEDAPLNATSPYGISKVTQERFADLYAERFDIPIYRVRAFNHTGVGQAPTFVLPSWCEQVATISASGKPGVIKVGNVEVVRDFSDVRDIVRAYRMIVESDKSGEVFNVGSGTGSPLSELLAKIISFSDQVVDVEVDEGFLRPSDTPVIVCDNVKIERELGWKPEHSIVECLRSLYDYFSAHLSVS